MGNSRRLVGLGCLLACCIYFVPELTYAARKIPVTRPASANDTFVKGAGTAGETTLDINRHWGEVVDVKPQPINLPVSNVSKYKWPRFKEIVKSGFKANLPQLILTVGGGYLLSQMPDADWDGFKLSRKQLTVNGEPASPAPVSAASEICSVPASQTVGKINVITTTSGEKIAVWVGYKSQQPSGYPTFYNNCTNSSLGYVGSWEEYAISGSLYPQSYGRTLSIGDLGDQKLAFTDSDWSEFANGIDSMSPNHLSDLVPHLQESVPGSFDYPDGETFDGPASVQGQPDLTTTTSYNPDGSTNTNVSESTPTYNFDYSTNPLSIDMSTTTTMNNYTNGTLTSTTTNVNNSPDVSSPEGEKVTDCDLVPTLCKWSEWTKQEDLPDKEELPVEEIEKPSSVTVGPGASCPAPAVISLPDGKTVEFSYQPTCDLMTIISPIVRGCGLLAACFILVWRRK